ncbi:unnamed protein product [Ilex paraguariensis]|uniref:DRBM domain-containing protein n=1 Tax=Ilex paraguariensis TaxID=185542 RepID=A0ABC8U085_9AQUA
MGFKWCLCRHFSEFFRAVIVHGQTDMYKNQLQELAQRSCFNLPSYACIREGPDHAPRFKASVNFNGEIFDSPSYCNTLRQAEHAAAEVALTALSTKGPSRSLTARVLDETGVYKNLLQETAHRAGLNLPVYTTVRSGPGHVPVFTSTVELAGMNFTGEPAKTKKQSEKNAAIAAWSALKRVPNLVSLSHTSKETDNHDQQEQVIVARVLSNLEPKYEGKTAWRKDQNQARRTMLKCHRDNRSINPPQYQDWKFMDLLMDSALEVSSQKQNSFASLLPSPPRRTNSNILPTSSSHNPTLHQSITTMPSPLKVMGRSQVKRQDVATPVDEHQKDEDEWLYGKLEVNKKPIEKEGPSKSISSAAYEANHIICRPFAVPNTGKFNTSVPNRSPQNEKTHIGTRPFGPPTPSQMAIPPPIKAPSCSHIRRTLYSGGRHPQRTAPAVQIRSVIPVCAAAPPRMRTPPNPPPMKEATSTPTQSGAEDSSCQPKVQRATVVLNPTQLDLRQDPAVMK